MTYKNGAIPRLYTLKVSKGSPFTIQPAGNPVIYHNGGESVYHLTMYEKDIKLRSSDSIENVLANATFNFDQLAKIDGSGILIDLDADGKTDIISMLLVDEGFFDTIKDDPSTLENEGIGIIGDPLIPISTSEAVASSSGASDSSGYKAASSNRSTNEVRDTSTPGENEIWEGHDNESGDSDKNTLSAISNSQFLI